MWQVQLLSKAVFDSQRVLARMLLTAGKYKLFWRKVGHKFSHPLGVNPKHQKYVKVVGQVSYISYGCVIDLYMASTWLVNMRADNMFMCSSVQCLLSTQHMARLLCMSADRICCKRCCVRLDWWLGMSECCDWCYNYQGC